MRSLLITPYVNTTHLHRYTIFFPICTVYFSLPVLPTLISFFQYLIHFLYIENLPFRHRIPEKKIHHHLHWEITKVQYKGIVWLFISLFIKFRIIFQAANFTFYLNFWVFNIYELEWICVIKREMISTNQGYIL